MMTQLPSKPYLETNNKGIANEWSLGKERLLPVTSSQSGARPTALCGIDRTTVKHFLPYKDCVL